MEKQLYGRREREREGVSKNTEAIESSPVRWHNKIIHELIIYLHMIAKNVQEKVCRNVSQQSDNLIYL